MPLQQQPLTLYKNPHLGVKQLNFKLFLVNFANKSAGACYNGNLIDDTYIRVFNRNTAKRQFARTQVFKNITPSFCQSVRVNVLHIRV